jgi:hypothetical protein
VSFDRPYTYVSWGGRIGGIGSPEIWQCGIKLANVGPTGGGGGVGALTTPGRPDIDALEDFYALAATMHTTAGICSGAWLTWARAASVGTNGLETGGDPVIYEGTATAGSVGTYDSGLTVSAASPQDALCVTLWSGQTTGSANYGRFYLPWFAGPIDTTTGVMSSVTCGNIAAAVHTFLDSVNDWADALAGTPDVAIMGQESGAGVENPKPALTKRCNVVRIGNVKDTQRRRRNRLAEAYTGVVLT